MLSNNSNHNCQKLNILAMSNRTYGLLVLIGILICAILTNVAEFYAIDYSIPSRNYSVLKNYGTHDLKEISIKYAGGTPVALFSPYLALSQIAPGANIWLPVDCPMNEMYLYGLGRAANVKKINYDSETLFADFDPTNFGEEIYGKLDDRGPGEVAFVVEEDKPSNLIVLWRNERWYMVDTALLTECDIEGLFQ